MCVDYTSKFLMQRGRFRARHRPKDPRMSDDKKSNQDHLIYSPRHVSLSDNNARNRVRSISGSSSNQDCQLDSALLDNDDNGDIIEGQQYSERVVIMTGRDDRGAEEDSGISEAPEDHLLPDSRDVEPRKETMWHIAIQVFIPFLIAGFGMMTAGLLLDKVQVNCVGVGRGFGNWWEREREKTRDMMK